MATATANHANHAKKERLGGLPVDRAVVEAFLEAISPAGLEAAIAAQDLGEAQDQAVLRQFGLQVERAPYEAERAEVATAPSNPKTAWSLALRKPSGRRNSMSTEPRKRTSRAKNGNKSSN